jgi:hypothetical protein
VNAANFGATTEPGEPLIDGSAGGHSLWWRWTAPRTEQVTVHTFGSEFDTLLGVYTGNALSALELIGENDDAGDGFQSLVDFQAVAGTLYHFAVDGLDGETGNIVLGWISGSPANDDFADGEPVEGPSGRVEAANFGATSEAGEPPIDGELGGHSVWWRWTAARDGDVTIHTYGTAFDTLLGVYTGEALGALQLVAENDDAEDQPGGCPRPPCNPCPRPPCRGRGILPLVTGLESRVDFAAVAGTVYHIKVDGLDEETGHILLTWFQHSGAPLANDHFADRSRIEGTEGLVLASNDGATRENGEPDHADSGGVLSLWWSWVAPGDGTLELNTLGSTFDTVLAVYTGNALDALDLAGVNDDAGGPNDDLTSRVSLGVATGTEYQIAVDSLDESGLVALSWSFSPEQAPALRFLRGDCDGNGDATGQVTDAVVLLSYNFLAGSEPACLAACDADGDGRVTGAVTDAIYLLNFNFRAGPPPVAPFPTCGAGTRESDAVLGCDRPPSICD